MTPPSRRRARPATRPSPRVPCPSKAVTFTASFALPDSEIRILLQKTGDGKAGKERMHLDLETDNVEAEVRLLEALGATRRDHQAERGFDFWVLHDPWGNEFCVLQPESPNSWPGESPGITDPSPADQRFPASDKNITPDCRGCSS